MPTTSSILSQINLANVKQFDDIWIKDGNFIFDGWVTKKENNYIYIVYTDNDNKLQEISFKIERPLNRTQIENDNKILYLNKYDV